MNMTALSTAAHAAAAAHRVPVALSPGDGIGPEIMRQALRVLEAAGARIEAFPVDVGQEVYRRGRTSDSTS